MVINKKIKNATETTIEGITFKSKLESRAYSLFQEHGLNAQYEGVKEVLLEGFYPKTPYYKRSKSGDSLTLQKGKIREWDYYPDFLIQSNGWRFYVEVKGFQNDLTPYKTKMFLHQLESQEKVVFFMVKTVKEIKECITIIDKYINGEIT